MPSLPTGGPVTGEGSLTDSIFAPIYLIAALLIMLRLGRFVQVARGNKLMLVLLGMAFISAFWSSVPDITIRRSIAIFATTAFGWYLVATYSFREILELIAWALGISAVTSLLYWFVMPGVIALEGGAWRGVYENKNVLARAMVLSSAAFMLLGLDRERRRWFAWGGAALSAAMVLLSRSGTGLVVLVSLTVLIKFSAGLRLRYKILVPVLIICGLVIVAGLSWVESHPDVAAAQLGKDATATGRTEIWGLAITMIGRHPWFGYGFGGFWLGWVGDSSEIWEILGWPTPHAHNGYLDLTLELGLCGLAIFVAGYLVALAGAIRRAKVARTSEAVGPLVVLAFMLLYNLTETTLLKHNDIFWVAYIAAASASVGAIKHVRARSPVMPHSDHRSRLSSLSPAWASRGPGERER